MKMLARIERLAMGSCRLWVAAPVLLFALGACDSLDANEETFSEDVVVESYQIAMEPLQPVYLSRTVPTDAAFEFENVALSGASVRIHRLDARGTVDETFNFTESDTASGVYVPIPEHRVLPLITYQLDVSFEDRDDRIVATTVVPDTFRIVAANLDTVVYQGADQLQLDVTPSRYPGRQNIYIFVSESLEPSFENLTPFAAGIIDDEDELEEFITGASPPLNEANYDLNLDGTITIKLPWLGVVFYGSSTFTINAIDDNVFDFVRSQSIQQGGSTFAPGEIPNVLEHVEGGRGVFGSYARAARRTYVKRPG